MKNRSQDHNQHPRLARELHTIEAMIALYCRAHHKPHARLCLDCSELLQYAGKRLGHCPFQENKPTCGKCTIHCYKPELREAIRRVMRYAGPRMMFRHPIMALHHLFDGRRKLPELPRRKKSSGGRATPVDLKGRSNT